jgi:hypothetical protein
MNVGRRVDYAVRALSYLAGQTDGLVVSRTDIEKSQDIPSFYLSKIMKDLVAGGLAVYMVRRAALLTGGERDLIGDVYETVERPLRMECLKGMIIVFCAVCLRTDLRKPNRWRISAGG